MNRYISLCLLGSLVFGTAMPASALESILTAPGTTIAQSQTQEAIAQELIRLLAAGDFKTAATKYNAEQKVTAENLEAEWSKFIDQHGAFQQQVEISKSVDNVVVITCEFEKGTMNLIVVLDNNNEVISLNLPES